MTVVDEVMELSVGVIPIFALQMGHAVASPLPLWTHSCQHVSSNMRPHRSSLTGRPSLPIDTLCRSLSYYAVSLSFS